MKILFAIIVLATSCSLEPKEEIYLGLRWSEVETVESFTPRRNFGAVYLNGAIVIIGGFIKREESSREELANDVWMSKDEGRTWLEIKTNTLSPTETFPKRQAFATVVIGNDIYIIGGYGDSGVCLNDIWKSSDLGATWTQIKEEADFEKRYGHNAVVLNDKDIFITSGRDIYGKHYNDTWKSTDFGESWIKISENNFKAREGFGLINYQNEFFLIGGHDINSIFTDILISEENGSIWYRHPNAPFEFFEHAIVSVEGDIFVVEEDHVWKSIDGGIKWTKVLFEAPFLSRRGFALLRINKKIILLGGIDEKDSIYLNDIWESKY